jgi:hypothetical protein
MINYNNLMRPHSVDVQHVPRSRDIFSIPRWLAHSQLINIDAADELGADLHGSFRLLILDLSPTKPNNVARGHLNQLSLIKCKPCRDNDFLLLRS